MKRRISVALSVVTLALAAALGNSSVLHAAGSHASQHALAAAKTSPTATPT